MSTTCQKCMRTIDSNEGRWMFTPIPGKPEFHLDKCQQCGDWRMAEKALVAQRIQQQFQQQSGKPGGCNCTGKR